jgi:erythromycin esterase-like protein
VNPALTAMANALRVGDHLLERLGAQVTTAGKPASDGQLQEVDS